MSDILTKILGMVRLGGSAPQEPEPSKVNPLLAGIPQPYKFLAQVQSASALEAQCADINELEEERDGREGIAGWYNRLVKSTSELSTEDIKRYAAEALKVFEKAAENVSRVFTEYKTKLIPQLEQYYKSKGWSFAFSCTPDSSYTKIRGALPHLVGQESMSRSGQPLPDEELSLTERAARDRFHPNYATLTTIGQVVDPDRLLDRYKGYFRKATETGSFQDL